MLDNIYMQILDMSKTASIVILAVLLARLLLKKAPKVFSYALWAVVLFRLLCPATMEAPVSIVPEMPSVSQDYTLSEEPISVFGAASAAYRAVGDALNGGLGVQHIPTTEKDENGMTRYVTTDWWSVWILFGQYVWVAGIAAMLFYSASSYLKIRKKLSVVIPLRDKIFLADDIKSPFVVGLFHPKIYLPCNLEDREQEYIILHEQHHIKRLDHIVKALAFLALAIHWFNPLVWLAFILASKDMEMSCDEAVIRKVGSYVRADYSASLLTLATGRRIIAGTPLAFGEGDTKGRIRNLANWRKPAFWVVLIAVAACAALAVGLLTNPAKDDTPDPAQDGYFLLIGTDGVESIKVSGPDMGGGAVHADGSAFQKGEKVRLEPLQGTTDLRGLSITALGKNGETLYTFSIPEGATKDEVIDLVGSDGWLLVPTGFESSLSDATRNTYAYEYNGIAGRFEITLCEDGTFTYLESAYSSYLGYGIWTQDGDLITLADNVNNVEGGYARINRFKRDGDDLIFVSKGSFNFPHVKLQDGDRFQCVEKAFETDTVYIKPEFESSRKLTLEDVVALSKKGHELTWSDFEDYYSHATGSGLYIRVYEINELFSLYIGGSWPLSTPMYIDLVLADDHDTRIDIRDGGVEEFIAADHSGVLLPKAVNAAILEHFEPTASDGLLACASFVPLAQDEVENSSGDGSAQVTVYAMALHETYSFAEEKVRLVKSWYIPVKLTFEKTAQGAFKLSDSWFPDLPHESWDEYSAAVYKEFSVHSEGVADSAIYALMKDVYFVELKESCHEQAVRSVAGAANLVKSLFEEIESSPIEAYRHDDYIATYLSEFRELCGYGKYTLQYIFSQFLEGGQTGLHGYLMREALNRIAPEARLRLYAETGQEYFDAWKEAAIRVGQQHDMEWIREKQPAIWLLLQMLDT